MNMLPEIRRRFDNIQRYGGLFQEELRTYFHMIDEAIIRYIGYLDYALAHSPSLLNPAIWFREGIQAWVAGPLTLLNWFGVLSAATVSQVTNHRAFKAFAGAAGAISLISGIFTIALGWGDMHKLISKWLGI